MLIPLAASILLRTMKPVWIAPLDQMDAIVNKFWFLLSARPTSFNMVIGNLIVIKSSNQMAFVLGSMGVFKYYQIYNGKPSYHAPNGQRLFYLNGSGWLIGPSLGSPTGKNHQSSV